MGALLTLLPSLLGGLWRLFLAPLVSPATWPGLALAAAVAFGWGWWKGDAHGDRQCAAAALRAEIARMQLEQKTKDEAAEQEAIDSAALLAEAERREKADADLIKELRSRPGQCKLGPDAKRV